MHRVDVYRVQLGDHTGGFKIHQHCQPLNPDIDGFGLFQERSDNEYRRVVAGIPWIASNTRNSRQLRREGEKREEWEER